MFVWKWELLKKQSIFSPFLQLYRSECVYGRLLYQSFEDCASPKLVRAGRKVVVEVCWVAVVLPFEPNSDPVGQRKIVIIASKYERKLSISVLPIIRDSVISTVWHRKQAQFSPQPVLAHITLCHLEVCGSVSINTRKRRRKSFDRGECNNTISIIVCGDKHRSNIVFHYREKLLFYLSII